MKPFVTLWLRLIGLLLLLLTGRLAALAQTGVTIGASTAPDASAALDIISTSKGVLLPRVALASAIASPATGLIVFQTGGTAGYYYYAGSVAGWQQLATASGAAVTASNGLTKTGQNIALGGTLAGATTITQGGNAFSLTGGNVGIGTSAPTGLLEVAVPAVVSGPNVDQSQTTQNTTFGYTTFHQSFTAGVSGQLQQLVTNVVGYNNSSRTGTTGTALLEIFAGATPGSTALASQSVSFGAYTADPVPPTTNTFATPATLTAGQVYCFRMTLTGGPANFLFAGLCTTNCYAGGSASSGGWDAAFQTLMRTTVASVPALMVQAAGVGIGTTAPSQKLEVAGTIYSTSGGFKFPNGTTQTTAVVANPAAAGPGLSGTLSGGVTTIRLGGSALSGATDVPLAGQNLTFSGTSGNVGIGTAAPAARLEVAGDLRVSGGLPTSGQISQPTFNTFNGWNFPAQSFALPAAGTLTSVGFYTNGNSPAYGNSTLTIYRGDGIGGTVLASQPVTLGLGGPFVMTLATPLTLLAGQYTFGLSGSSIGLQSNTAGPYAGGSAYQGNMIFTGRDFAFVVNYTTTAPTTLAATTAGNVGIGTATPSQKLDVTGGSIRIGSAGSGLIFPDGSTQTTATLTGPAGPAGAAGPQGPQGTAGVAGAPGPVGSTGAIGATGPQGSTGLTGNTGNTGNTGPIGPVGPIGPAGTTGPQGPAGTTGPQGPAGTNGTAGTAGSDGRNALVQTTAEAAGANCATGGTKVESGPDTNANGTLDAGEIATTRYVCNGTNGTNAASSGVSYDPTTGLQVGTGVVGTDTNVPTGTINSNGPFRGDVLSARTETLYSASYLRAQGLRAGPFTALTYAVITKRSTQPYSNFTVALANSPLTTLGTTFSTAGLVPVYSGAVTLPATGVLTLPFNGSAFVWDGTSSVVVQTCFLNTTITDDDLVRGRSVTGSRIVRATGTGVCAAPAGTSIPDQPSVAFAQPPRAYTLPPASGTAGQVLTQQASGAVTFQDPQWTQAGTNLFPDLLTSKVGIGTSTPVTKLDVNGNLRLAVRLCPANGRPHNLSAADIAFSIFLMVAGSHSPTLTLPPASAGQVEGQQLTIINRANSTSSILAANTDNTTNTVLPASSTAGTHAFQYIWASGAWVRVQ